MSQCTLCGHQLERSSHSSRSKIRSTNDVATETDALYIEELIPGSSNVVRPTKLNSNGTIVGISTNFISGTKELVGYSSFKYFTLILLVILKRYKLYFIDYYCFHIFIAYTILQTEVLLVGTSNHKIYLKLAQR